MATKNQSLDVNEALNSSEAFIVKNKKILIGALIAIVVVVVGFFAYRYNSAKNNDKASTILAKGQNYFAQGNYETALNGDNAGYIGFLKIAKKYSGTDAGNLANLYAGLSYAQNGDAKNAVKFLKEYDGAGDHMISPAALGALGNCYAQIGQIDKAIETLKKAAEKASNNSLSPIYLLQAGELLESQNKLDEAKALYQEIKKKYGKTPDGEMIDKYIQRVSK